MTHNQTPDDNYEWEPPERRRPRRLDEETAEVGFPIAWVLIGGLAGLLTIGLIGLGVVQIVNKRSAPTPTPPGLPTLALPATPPPLPGVVGTPTLAPATSTPSPSTAEVVQPTATPQPVAPSEIKVGGYVKLVNTEGAGLSLRAGPGRNNARLVTANADSILAVIGGPKEDEQGAKDDAGKVYQWWYLRHTDGTEGWGRADFLAPSPPPSQ